MTYEQMIQEQAKKYNSTVERMDIANRAFNGSDDYECILLDIYVSYSVGQSASLSEYLQFVADMSNKDFEEVINEVQ